MVTSHNSSLSTNSASSNVNDNKPEITKLAQRLRREGTIEEILLKRKNEYKAHLEQLRRDREEQELNMLTSPQINKSSQQLVRNGRTHLRLYDLGKSNQQKREQLRTSLEEQERASVKLQPEINKSSKNLERSVENILAWKKERDQKQREFKQQLEEKELSACSKPKINPTSERLARKMHRSDQRVGERLFQQHEVAWKRKEEQRRKSQEKEKNGASPMISIHSANLQREGEVSDRLYRISFDMIQKRHEQQERVEQDQLLTLQSGHKLFSPLINTRSALLQRDQPIEEILMTKGEEAEMRRKSLLEQEFSIAQEEQQRIKIGPYSQVLSEIKAKRDNISEQERLLQPIRQIKPSFQAWVAEENQTLTFSPDINENSREIDKHLHGENKNRTQLLFKKAEEYLKRRERLQQQQVAEEMAECTFSPRSSSPLPTTFLNNSILSLGSSGSAAVTPEESRHFVNRNKEWADKVQEKLELERQSLEAQQMEACTFRPNVSRIQIADPRRASTPPPSGTRSLTPTPRRSSTYSALGGRRSVTPQAR